MYQGCALRTAKQQVLDTLIIPKFLVIKERKGWHVPETARNICLVPNDKFDKKLS